MKWHIITPFVTFLFGIGLGMFGLNVGCFRSGASSDTVHLTDSVPIKAKEVGNGHEAGKGHEVGLDVVKLTAKESSSKTQVSTKLVDNSDTRGQSPREFAREVNTTVLDLVSSSGTASAIDYLDSLPPGFESSNAVHSSVLLLASVRAGLSEGLKGESIKGILRWFSRSELAPQSDITHSIDVIIGDLVKFNKDVALESWLEVNKEIDFLLDSNSIIGIRNQFEATGEYGILMKRLGDELSPDSFAAASERFRTVEFRD